MKGYVTSLDKVDRSTVILEVKVGDSWGDECSVGQVKKQALDSANIILNKAFSAAPEISVKAAAECTSVNYYK